MHISKPVGNRLLVQPLEQPAISSVLHVPASRLPYMNSSVKSRVLKIGTKVSPTLEVQEGDIVIHNCEMGYPVPGKEGLLLLHADDVLAKETPLGNEFYSSPVSKTKIQ